MWHKTLAGMIAGLCVLLFIPTGISLIYPALTALMISCAILLLTPAWALIMTYCYAAASTHKAWLRSALFTVSSLFFYCAAYLLYGFSK